MITNDSSVCPLCTNPFGDTGSVSAPADTLNCEVTCARCGTFNLTDSAQVLYFGTLPGVQGFSERRHLLCGLARTAFDAGSRLTVNEELCQRIEGGRERGRTVPEKIDLLMHWFAIQSKHLGDPVATDDEVAYPVAFCRNAKEWTFLRSSCLERGLLIHADPGFDVVTTKGWEWLDERPKAAGDRAFIAMSFHPDLKPVGDAIEKAIRDAGYQPTRVDQHEYVGGVMDKVLALIRQSRFVVADFTQNRGGVYYEAAFAAGRDIPVIPTCRVDHLDPENKSDRLHFDVSHLNFLSWDDQNLPDFQKRLQLRIEALFGRGPRTRAIASL